MKTSLRPLVAAVILALGTAFVGVAEGRAQSMPPVKVAIVDLLLIQKQSLAMKGLLAELDQRRQIYQEEINGKEQELNAFNQELILQQSILAAEAFAQKRREFEARSAELQREVQERRRELEQARGRGLREVERVVFDIIAELAEVRGFNLVLARQQIVFSSTGMNISQEVIERLNQRLPRVEGLAAPN